MPFATIHDVRKGITRLMNAPRDLPASAPWLDPPITKLAASEAHRVLFEQYLQFMEDAVTIAEEWWQGMIEALEQGGIDRDSAIEAAYNNRFAGPATCPEVVWTLRKFWLECVTLNSEVPELQRVPPEVFLLYWLLDGQHDDWIQLITGMPYWPIGLDELGNWV